MVNTKKWKVCISACLLGFKYRYDGGSDFMPELIAKYKDAVDFLPVCPEVESGLPIPRKKMHLEASNRGTRLIVTETGEDRTDPMLAWADVKLDQIQRRAPAACILHSKSPCCGLCSAKLYNRNGRLLPSKGTGIFAGLLRLRFPDMPVCDETEADALLRRLTGKPES